MSPDMADGPVTLSELRAMSGRSQSYLAERLGTTQSGVSRIERQDDTRISTLVEYVAHLGGRLRLVVERSDGDVELMVPALVPAETSTPRAARVIWQDDSTRSFHVVGSLDFDGDLFRFAYAADIHAVPEFEPFEGLKSLDRVHESPELFDVFARRLPVAADPSFQSVLEALGLSRRHATPVELLSYPVASPSDPVQLVPEPTIRADGTVEGTFLVSGVRYADAESDGLAARVIERLQPGDQLLVRAEPSNPANADALAISMEGVRVGYVPNFLLGDIARLQRDGRTVQFQVERANGPEASWHLRLLARFVAPRA